MNRKQAISLIEELDGECKDIAGRSFLLVKPDENNRLALGYQVSVKIKLSEIRLRRIVALLAQYGYSLLKDPEKESMLIFEPRTEGKMGVWSVKRDIGLLQ